MAEPLRHRQTKEAATDMFSLQPTRHISTLHNASLRCGAEVWTRLEVKRTSRRTDRTYWPDVIDPGADSRSVASLVLAPACGAVAESVDRRDDILGQGRQ